MYISVNHNGTITFPGPGDVVFKNGVFQRVIWKGAAPILQVELVGYAAGTDTGSVNRYNGKDFAHLNGNTDLETVRTGVVGWTDDGLIIPNGGITSGELKIYHR